MDSNKPRCSKSQFMTAIIDLIDVSEFIQLFSTIVDRNILALQKLKFNDKIYLAQKLRSKIQQGLADKLQQYCLGFIEKQRKKGMVGKNSVEINAQIKKQQQFERINNEFQNILKFDGLRTNNIEAQKRQEQNILHQLETLFKKKEANEESLQNKQRKIVGQQNHNKQVKGVLGRLEGEKQQIADREKYNSHQPYPDRARPYNYNRINRWTTYQPYY